VSMRIGVQTEASILSNARADGVKTAGSESTTAHMPVSSLGTDEVSLSNASGLVSLAKTLTPADKQTKVVALTAPVRSGQYRAETAQVARSIVQAHLKN